MVFDGIRGKISDALARKRAAGEKAAQQEVELINRLNGELRELERQGAQMRKSFIRLKTEMAEIRDLRRKVKKAHDKKAKILAIDIRRRRKYRIGDDGKHVLGNTKKELKYARRKHKITAKEIRELRQLDRDLADVLREGQILSREARKMLTLYQAMFQELELQDKIELQEKEATEGELNEEYEEEKRAA